MKPEQTMIDPGDVKTIYDHEYLIYQRGFLCRDHQITKTSGFLLDELNNLYKNCREEAVTTGKAAHFYLGLTAYLGHQREKVDMKFKYRYDPDTSILKLTSLRTRMGIEKKLYLFKSNSDLPAIKTIHNHLNKQTQIRKWHLFKNSVQAHQKISKSHSQNH